MFEKDITKDSYKVLCIIYKAYLQRVKSGEATRIASVFVDDKTFGSVYAPDISYDDLYAAIVELKNNGYVKKYIDGGFCLLSSGIVLLENRFKNNLSDVIDFLGLFG